MVIRQGGVDDASRSLIEVGFFCQSETDAHDDTSFELTGGHFAVQYLPGIEGT
jgi:hypothetical protein